jgi:two-component system LytT family response regulator
MNRQQIHAIIVDDEPYASQALVTLLGKQCPEIIVTAVCNDPRDAKQLIKTHQPQLVFLDIEMPHLNGFGLLQELRPFNFEVIFTTSYDQYAIQAIRFSALDYLLKPVDAKELKAAVEKFMQRAAPSLPQQLDILLSKFHQTGGNTTGRIALPTMEGLQIIAVSDIIYCSSNSNYTILVLKDKQKLTISRTLKEVEEMLEQHRFLRIHHSYLVNLDEVRTYVRGEGGSVVMSDGSSVDVSRSKKETLLKSLLPNK